MGDHEKFSIHSLLLHTIFAKRLGSDFACEYCHNLKFMLQKQVYSALFLGILFPRKVLRAGTTIKIQKQISIQIGIQMIIIFRNSKKK